MKMLENSELIGMRYGRLIVLSETCRGRKKVVCRCDCGVRKTVSAANLKAGNTTSCGCRQRERSTTHGLYNHPLYTVHADMMRRCYRETDEAYINYGARGISVHPRWHDVRHFIADMNDSYREHAAIHGKAQTSLDRICNDGDYTPDNTRWATWSTQAVNKRRQANNTSGVPGVYWHKAAKKWAARIDAGGKRIHLGYFADKSEAIAERKAAEAKYHAGAKAGATA